MTASNLIIGTSKIKTDRTLTRMNKKQIKIKMKSYKKTKKKSIILFSSR